MTQKKFKKLLDKNGYSYRQDGKWLIIGENGLLISVFLSFKKLESLPDYLWFKNKGNVFLNNNNLKYLPKNLIFENGRYLTLNNNQLKDIPKSVIIKNKYDVSYNNNNNLILEYYPHLKKSYDELELQLYNKYLHESFILNKHISNIADKYQTPNICLINIIKQPGCNEFIKINLPKSYLNIISWI